MNTQITLKNYIYEDMNVILPQFDKIKNPEPFETIITTQHKIYSHKKINNLFAVRCTFIVIPKKKKIKSRFKIKITIVGFVKLGENNFTEKQKLNYISKKSDHLLYEVIKKPLTTFCQYSVITNSSIPKKLKKL
jgi:hypothetical protein